MIIRRQRLGSTYTKSPADNTKAWMIINLSKIIFTVVATIAYLIFLYIGIGIVGFIGTEVATVWEEGEFVTSEVYQGALGTLLKVVGILFLFIYIFKDAHKVKK